MYLGVIIFFLSCFDLSRSYEDDYTCVQQGYCSCIKKNGEIVDLLPLVATASQPLLVSTSSYMFMYHPCKDVPLNTKQKNDCQSGNGYGICYFEAKDILNKPIDFNSVISNTTLGSFKKLALNGEATFQVNKLHQVEIIYKHATVNDSIIVTTVQLRCDEKLKNYSLTVEKNTQNEVLLILSSHYLCLSNSNHMSRAAVFFLIIVILLALYFVGGILVLKFLRGATGVEMIPNHEFWCKLPERIKNGFTYLCSLGKRTPDSYEKI